MSRGSFVPALQNAFFDIQAKVTTITMSLKELIAANTFDHVETFLNLGEAVGRLGLYNLFSQKAISYPLHYLCRQSRTPVSTMQSMIRESPPKAFVYWDSAGQSTPLHLACWYKLPVDTILLLLESSQEALLMEDIDGNLPLHLAAAFHPEADRLIEAFLKARPETAKRRNGKNQMALHSLCTREDIPIQVLKRLLEADSKAAQLNDRMGRLPIHHACLQKARIEVMECLLQTYPQSVNVHDHAALTPYGIVRRRWHWTPKDPRVQLLRKDMIQSSSPAVAVRNQIQFQARGLVHVVQ
uniref:Uncharacterized protein n=1 Tax=Amphora coffeiformis TaxID=265554 RepID=A0A7S3L5K1_9STRA